MTYLYPQHDGGKTYAGFTPAELALSDEMARCWGNFVKQGDPNGTGLPLWPSFSRGQLLSFDIDSKTAPITTADFAGEHECDFWDRLAGETLH